MCQSYFKTFIIIFDLFNYYAESQYVLKENRKSIFVLL